MASGGDKYRASLIFQGELLTFKSKSGYVLSGWFQCSIPINWLPFERFDDGDQTSGDSMLKQDCYNSYCG
jgi:hypothetical protein